jgi:16S rRNA (guanine527-N7)-methyltransferase
MKAHSDTFDLAEDRKTALKLAPVSRETAARLDRFVNLLLEWQSKINLVASSTQPCLWTRHVADSLQLLALAPDARRWVDFGSGGGLPGLPIACALPEHQNTGVHLVESNSKKAAFLREAIRVGRLPARVHAMRVEDYGESSTDPVEVVTARALAPLKVLCDQAFPFIARGAIGLFLKGQDVDAELTEAAKYWKLETTTVQSRTNRDGRIVIVRGLERRGRR